MQILSTSEELIAALDALVKKKPKRHDRNAISQWLNKVDRVDEIRARLAVRMSLDEEDQWTYLWGWRDIIAGWLHSVCTFLFIAFIVVLLVMTCFI